MGINYGPLWKLLIDRKMTKTELRLKVGFTTSALAKMNKNQPVSLGIIESICKTLSVPISEVVEYKE